MCDFDTSKVVGVGPFTGWTRKDFIDEMKEQRNQMSKKNISIDERDEIVMSASGLLLRCDDRKWLNKEILFHFQEMHKRLLMSLSMQ